MKTLDQSRMIPAKSSAPWAILSIVLVILLGLVFFLNHRSRPASPLLVYGSLPDFSLITQDGKPVSKMSLLGHPWIADFIFTSCSGQCPQMSATMMALASGFAGEKEKNIRLVSFSVDPKRDTPEILSRYAQRYHADATRWLFVTGRAEDIYRLSRQGFKLGVDENTPDAPNIAVEPILHSSRLILVDAKGNIRGYYDTAEPDAVKRLKADVRRLP